MIKKAYNGRRGGLILEEGRPLVFAEKRREAEWSAYNRGDFNKPPIVTTVSLEISNPADYQDLMKAVKETEVGAEDIQKHSSYEGNDVIGYLYVPEVREKLIDDDFDSFEGWHIFTNTEIMITAVFDPACITVKKQEQIQ